MYKYFPIILSIFFAYSYSAHQQIENYPNGNKKSEGKIKGLFCKHKSGEWIYYYPNGLIKEKGEYKGIFESKHGRWISYYESGKKWKEEDFKRGKYVGIQKEWFENGQIKEDCNLTNNILKNGQWTSYFENGQIKEVEIYKDNYLENSKDLASSEEIARKYRSQDGVWMKYYKKDRDGQWTTYYKNGQKKKEGSYKNGLKDGLWTQWYENGQKRVECRHNGNIIDPESGVSVHSGKYTVWTQDGQVKKEGNSINGVNEWENIYNGLNSYTITDSIK